MNMLPFYKEDSIEDLIIRLVVLEEYKIRKLLKQRLQLEGKIEEEHGV